MCENSQKPPPPKKFTGTKNQKILKSTNTHQMLTKHGRSDCATTTNNNNSDNIPTKPLPNSQKKHKTPKHHRSPRKPILKFNN